MGQIFICAYSPETVSIQNMAYMLKCMENGRKNGIEKPEYEKGEKTNFIR